MPIRGDSSIVPDSTLSSSPPATTPAIKRATRTYGRPQIQGAVNSSDTSLLESSFISESRDRIYKTGPPGIDEEIPPSSDPSPPLEDTDDEKENSARNPSPEKFQFSWRKALLEIDEQDDFDVEMIKAPGTSQAQAVSPLSNQREPRHSFSSPAPSDSGSNPLTDAFGGSLTTITASPSSLHSTPAKTPSPENTPVHRRLGKRPKPVIEDSDEDETKQASSSQPFITGTPKSTPPTSNNHTPLHLSSTSSSKRKGKGKARANLDAVAPGLAKETTETPPAHPQEGKRSKKSKIKVC